MVLFRKKTQLDLGDVRNRTALIPKQEIFTCPAFRSSHPVVLSGAVVGDYKKHINI
jgi:hypothetical protein